jgi:excisionase family DNA binding protein
MQTEKALSVLDVSALTGWSQNYIYKLIHLKKIPHYKPMGGRVFFKQTELEAFIFQNRQCPTFEGTSHA